MHPLKKARLDLGYSQQMLADFIGVSTPTIKRAEAGKQVRVDIVRLICDFFADKYKREVEPQELGLAQQEKQDSEDLSPLQNNSSVLITPTFDAGIADKLESAEIIINLAWETWFASRPREVARTMNKLLPGLEKIAYSFYPAIHTTHAKKLAIRAHGLLGSVCSDALQHDTALFHYMQAHRIAEEIHETDLMATYLCFIGEVLRHQNDQASALSHMENARDLAYNASKATRGHILQMLAYAYGDNKQEDAFDRAISEATDLLSFSGEGIDASKKEFIPFEIYETRGKIYRDLGKPTEAIPYLELAEQALVSANAVTPRWHALLEISRAQTFCDAGDMKKGTELARKGFILAYQCHSRHQMNRVRKLVRKLESGPARNHPGVPELKHLVYETYMNMDNAAI
ncbi:hypothetical protein KDH_43690 [Dictyobacter sp. S3.2.2.5]|uniref:HTH cro/C1-type domain-containing protein n=1 Tax=Dictyobacter halimunensis TaxID=3026934 RepID=A0ABQ6FV23_9CHLR|nr:hypothetical protein KDH_43690 [Dictyobacter sp. S3.2.2.5]